MTYKIKSTAFAIVFAASAGLGATLCASPVMKQPEIAQVPTATAPKNLKGTAKKGATPAAKKSVKKAAPKKSVKKAAPKKGVKKAAPKKGAKKAAPKKGAKKAAPKKGAKKTVPKKGAKKTVRKVAPKAAKKGQATPRVEQSEVASA